MPLYYKSHSTWQKCGLYASIVKRICTFVLVVSRFYLRIAGTGAIVYANLELTRNDNELSVERTVLRACGIDA